MPVSDEYTQYIRERLEVVGPIFIRKMFGGLGIYHDGVHFALVNDNVLYFKVDNVNQPDFEEVGMGPFISFGDDSHPMQYYEVPADVLENDDFLIVWADRAVAVARRSKMKKSAKRRKTGKRK